MHTPITIAKEDSLSSTIRKLIDYNISRLIVQKSGKPVGIVSEKDIGFFLFKENTQKSLEQINLEKIAKEIIFAHPSTAIKECAEIMFDKNIGSLVVGSNDNLQGIITKTDVIRYFSESHKGKGKVVDIKNPGYVSVTTESSLADVIQKMLDKKVSRVIVVDTKRKPVGIISFRDFFGISLQLGSEEDVTESAALSGYLRTGFLSEKGFGGVSLARDIMTPKIILINPDDDLSYACKVMLENNVNGLVINDDKGKIGIVSKSDIVRFLTLIN